MSSTVTFFVYSGSDRTKSSGSNFETGVVHWTSGYFSSSTRQATDAAAVCFEVLAKSKSVCSVHFLPERSARPKPYRLNQEIFYALLKGTDLGPNFISFDNSD